MRPGPSRAQQDCRPRNRSVAGWVLAFACVTALACALRLPQLAARPMHADEAIHADKLGTLLEGGGYAYDPAEYHGPTLYYLTLLSARLAGVRRAVDVDEVLVRGVPAVLGVLLVALHAGARGFLGARGALVAAVLAALSPAMVFYSRYAIHEMLLVVFTFGVLLSGWHYARTQTAAAALTLGLSAGLMLATKETAGLALIAMVAAAALTRLAGHAGIRGAIRPQHAALAAATAAGVCVVLFTSFFTRPQGLLDALRASSFYLDRATASWHVHPWDYYLRLLLHTRAEGTPFWSEGLIVALALAGGLAAWFGPAGAEDDGREHPRGDLEVGEAGGSAARARLSARTMLRFLGLYTLLLLGLYSAIPYKTPWCVLSFLHGMILLAGFLFRGVLRRTPQSESRSASSLFRGVLRRTPQTPPPLRGSESRSASSLFWPVGKALGGALLAAATLHLGWQAYAGSFVFAADPRNPYVYGHTGTDVFEIVARVQALARVHPAGAAMPVQVISRDNVWPLPFYLRRLRGVAWWTGVADEAKTAPVVLITPDMEEALVRKLYDLPPPGERELYVSIFERPVWLRPGVEIRGYAARSLWEAHLQREAAVAP